MFRNGNYIDPISGVDTELKQAHCATCGKPFGMNPLFAPIQCAKCTRILESGDIDAYVAHLEKHGKFFDAEG